MLIRRADQPVVPWRNGGGSTREVAVSPAGAGSGEFTWRVSQATVARDGPFSRFPGVDRTLLLLSGDGCTLTIDGREVLLDRPLAPIGFPGEAAVTCRLLAGPLEDLNVMVARAAVRAEVTVREVPGLRRHRWPQEGLSALLFLASGALEVEVDGQPVTLEPGDALRCDGPPSAACWEAATGLAGGADVVLVAFHAVEAGEQEPSAGPPAPAGP